MNKRLIALSVELVVIGMLLGASIVQALTPSVSLTISSGVYPGAPSYTVWKEGSNYYAKNEYGEIEYSGTVFITVLTSCFGSGNVEIYIAPGTYYITSTINWNKQDIKLYGAGQETFLMLDDSIISTYDQPIFNITQFGTLGFWVENLVLDGNRAHNTGGVGFFCGRNFENSSSDIPNIHGFRNVIVQNCYWTGYRIADPTLWGSLELQVISCWAFRNGGHGFDFHGSDHKIINCVSCQNDYSGFYIIGTNIQLSNCKAYGNDYDNNHQGEGFTLYSNYSCGNQLINCQAQDNLFIGFLLYNASDYNILSGCQALDNSFDNTGAYAGIKIDNSDNNVITGFISGCQHTTHRQLYGILESGTSDYNIITSGTTYNNTSTGIIAIGANTQVNLCYNETSWIP